MKKNTIKTLFISFLVAVCMIFTSYSSAYAEDSAPTPIGYIEVLDYSIDGGMLVSGSDVILKLTLHNTSKLNDSNNVALSFSATNNFLYPVYGTDNQVLVGTISAGGSKEVEIPLTVSSSFGGEYVGMTFDLTYVTAGYKQYNTANIVIPTSGGNRIGVKSVDVATHAVVGGRSLISLKYSNHTNEDILDAKLVIDGNVSPLSKEIAMDTIYSNKDYLKDFYVCFTEDGIQTITIALCYSDSLGNEYNEEIGTYSISVSKDIMTEVQSGTDSIKLAYIGLGIMGLSALLLLFAILRYAKKHK